MLHQSCQVHTLLLQMKHKNNEAAGTLYQRYQPIIYFTARRYGLSHEEAEEAVQQTFLRLLEHGIVTYQEEKGGGATWLWLVVRSTILNMIRKRHRRWQHELAVDSLQDILAAPDEEEPEYAALERELRDTATRTLEAMTEEDRQEIKRGKNRGTPRVTWQQALKRATPLFTTQYTTSSEKSSRSRV